MTRSTQPTHRRAARRLARGAALAALATAGAFAYGGQAHAATVSLQDCGFGCSRLAFQASPGEVNYIDVIEGGFLQPYTVADNAPLYPGSGCSAIDANAVKCGGFNNIGQASFDLGDQNDTLRWSANTAQVTVSGGGGNDYFQGWSGWQNGVVTFDGGPGNDTLQDWARKDVFLGGDGADTVRYGPRTNAVTVDLAAGTGGEAGETDQLTDVESVLGGSGNDVFRGGIHAETLDGGPGNDYLEGRTNVDTLIGGGGDDNLYTRDFSEDTVGCGDGVDFVTADTVDVVASDCENVGAPLPGVSIGSATTVEGNADSTVLAIPLTLSEPSGRTVQAPVTFADGTAQAGIDYDGAPLTATFAPHATQASVYLRIYGDTAVEPNETLTARLGAPTNGQIGTPSSATVTIMNDDAPTVQPPVATTNPAGAITAAKAKLKGTVNPNGDATTWYFEYGTTTAYGKKTATKALLSPTGVQAVAVAARRLAPSTTYHYRLVATNAAGTSYGADRAFTTLAA